MEFSCQKNVLSYLSFLCLPHIRVYFVPFCYKIFKIFFTFFVFLLLLVLFYVCFGYKKRTVSLLSKFSYYFKKPLSINICLYFSPDNVHCINSLNSSFSIFSCSAILFINPSPISSEL